MLIVIPMAGQSSRFRKAGYKEQKFRLPLEGKTVFDHTVSSFARYFDCAEFLFVTRSGEDYEFALEHAAALNVRKAKACVSRSPRSFHHAVFVALMNSDVRLDQPVILLAVDTFRPNFVLPDGLEGGGYIESCYQNSKTLRSLYKLGGRSLTEPQSGQSRILPHKLWAAFMRGTSLYYFPNAARLVKAYGIMEEKHKKSRFLSRLLSEDLLDGVLLFREILRPEHRTYFRLINRDDVIFCGAPREYEALLKARAG